VIGAWWLAGLLALAAPFAAQAGGETARSLLERGDALRSEARTSQGRQRQDLRERAVGVYRSVRERFPEDRASAAQAAFRAGELLRSDGDERAAREEFAAARALAEDATLAARAAVEVGHIERRAGLFAEALAVYQAVATGASTPTAERDRARLWVGRSQHALGRFAEARATLDELAREARDPCLRVAAHDERALVWIAEGDLEAAAGELERCRRALRSRAEERTPAGERVRAALRGMRAVARLARAVAERDGAIVV
jgi:tetratricopeptide (TPR) repeat protein